jgi:glycosyltransferase involved in cell wall biosynthesis
MLRAIEQHYGALPITRVIPNGRSAAMFHTRAKEPLVLSAGRLWDRAKNIQILARIAPLLRWPVLVAGDEADPHGVRTSYANVRPLGRLSGESLARWLGRASLYVLPARYEPFGLSALEAGLSGCALVLGDIDSLREVWGDAAVFVAPDDPIALVRTLESLIENEGWRATLGARAYARACEFSPDRMAAGYISAYGEAIASTQRGRLLNRFAEADLQGPPHLRA